MMDRPHILYNEKTGKYVAWLKIMGEPPCFAVLAADHILGPYEMVNPRVNPCGLMVGDFDLQSDPVTKKGYLINYLRNDRISPQSVGGGGGEEFMSISRMREGMT